MAAICTNVALCTGNSPLQCRVCTKRCITVLNPIILKDRVLKDVMCEGAASKDRGCIYRTQNTQTPNSQCNEEGFHMDVLSSRHTCLYDYAMTGVYNMGTGICNTE